MRRDKRFWIGLSLVNLCGVGLFGFLMRTKILYSIPFLDYRNTLSAHSHLAFSGWVGLALSTLLIYEVLPAPLSKKKIYQIILWGMEISSVGMAVSFPFGGYYSVSIFFSTLYIICTYALGWMLFKDLKKTSQPPVVRRLSLGSVVFLMLSSAGPFTLSYIMITKSTDSLLYRDAIYSFLHFQYNGFFTLAILALFFNALIKRNIALPPAAKTFSVCLLLSVLPSLFITILWHKLTVFYVVAITGCVLMVASVFLFLPIFSYVLKQRIFNYPLAKVLWVTAFVSFIIKMLLAVGTVYAPLADAVYGARPVIIGFLHLVFLAFVSFFILSQLVEGGYYSRGQKLATIPFYVFGFGVLANEAFLMIQGLEILFKTNSNIYSWLLWGAAIVLFTGALLLAFNYYQSLSYQKKKAAATAAAV